MNFLFLNKHVCSRLQTILETFDAVSFKSIKQLLNHKYNTTKLIVLYICYMSNTVVQVCNNLKRFEATLRALLVYLYTNTVIFFKVLY